VDDDDAAPSRRAKASTRGRKDKDECDFPDESSADAIDSKYYRLYEEKIDPFRVEELDRLALISRLNILERGLAHLTRFFLQDQWARHVLMLYIFLLHCFALAYVVNVLNPQLIDEVDVHMKTKWSKATLEFGMDREHPDVRW
jgi:hypothetical protein